MQGIESSYCNVCCKALIAAWQALLESSATEALKKVRYGKCDTLGLDATPEIIISGRLHEHDRHALLITEELGSNVKERWPTDSDPVRQPIMFFADPTDRSAFLEKFILQISKDQLTVPIGQLMKEIDSIKTWQSIGEEPASITGATSAITCVRKGEIIFTVILNYITQTIFVAVTDQIIYLHLPDYTDPLLDEIDLRYILENGTSLSFPPARSCCKNADNCKRFVSFLGKTGYRENFSDSMIIVDNPNKYLHHTNPGGPARIFYLSTLQQSISPIGFILANGEKITEWIHWLAFVKFAKNSSGTQALQVFEIFIERPWTKDGVLMSTSPPYSIFSSDGEKGYLDISRLKNFDNPSRFRSMLIVTPSDNERIIYLMRQNEYRNVSSFI